MDRSTRILVANQPTLMRELLLATLAEEPGVQIVGEVADASKICEQVHRTEPDLLVIALDEPSKRPEICDTLLQRYPKLRIIAVASRQNCGIFYWGSFDIHCHEIEPSERGFLTTVRNMTPTGAGKFL